MGNPQWAARKLAPTRSVPRFAAQLPIFDQAVNAKAARGDRAGERAAPEGPLNVIPMQIGIHASLRACSAEIARDRCSAATKSLCQESPLKLAWVPASAGMTEEEKAVLETRLRVRLTRGAFRDRQLDSCATAWPIGCSYELKSGQLFAES